MAVMLLTVAANTRKPIGLTLKKNGVVIPLTGCTVKLVIKNTDTDEVMNTAHQSCTVLDATAGTISYQPETGDFGTGGRFLCSAIIYDALSKPEELHEKLLVIAEPKAQ